MSLFELNRKQSNRELRWFAGLWFPAFCVVTGAAIQRIFNAPFLKGFIWVTAAILSIAGLYSPRIIRPVYIGLCRLTFPLGWLLSHVLLGMLYFGVITPIGFLMRRLHDPMNRSFDRAATSYWKPREVRSMQSYVRQF